MKPVPFKLDSESKTKLYFQLYQAFVEAFRNGSYAPQEKIPSVRQLSKELSISRNTVISAYNMLLEEGFIVSHNKSGYTVNLTLPSANSVPLHSTQENEALEKPKKKKAAKPAKKSVPITKEEPAAEPAQSVPNTKESVPEEEFEIPTVDGIFKEREGTEVTQIPVPEDLEIPTVTKPEEEKVEEPVISSAEPAEQPDSALDEKLTEQPESSEETENFNIIPQDNDSETDDEQVICFADLNDDMELQNDPSANKLSSELEEDSSEEKTAAEPEPSVEEQTPPESESPVEEKILPEPESPVEEKTTSESESPVEEKILPEPETKSEKQKSSATLDLFGERNLRKTIALFLYNNFQISCTSGQIYVAKETGDPLVKVMNLIAPSKEEPKQIPEGIGLFAKAEALLNPEKTFNPPKISLSENALNSFHENLKTAGYETYQIPKSGNVLDLEQLFTSDYDIAILSPAVDHILDRDELLAWVSENEKRYIIEYYQNFPDDIALCCENINKIIFLGSIGGIAFMILPSVLITKFRTKYADYECTLSTDEQSAAEQKISSLNTEIDS